MRIRVLTAALAAVLVAATPALAAPADAATASGSVPFGSRPSARPITCDGKKGVRISGHTFRNIGDSRPAITITGCRDVVIEDNDFVNDAEPIYVYGSRNITIRNNRYRNITGPYQRDGSHRGNFTQWDHSYGGRIVGNTGVGGDTEDVVSLYFSGGTSAAHPLVIARNRFQGTNWRSSSGAGILVGDGGGSHVVVRDNELLNVGQVGIGVAGGHDIRILRNTVYGPRRSKANVGIYTWGQGATCGNVRVAGNVVDFTKADGTPSAIWDGGNCGRVTGLSTNTVGPLPHAKELRVRL